MSVTPDGDVETLFEGSGSCEETIELEAGNTRIARIGVDASGKLTGEVIGLEGATSKEIEAEIK